MKNKLIILGAWFSFCAHAVIIDPSLPVISMQTPPSTPQSMVKPSMPPELKVKLADMYGQDIADKLDATLNEASKLGDSWLTEDWAVKIWATYFDIPTEDLNPDINKIWILTDNREKWMKKVQEGRTDLTIISRKRSRSLSVWEYVADANIAGLIHPRLLLPLYEIDPDMLALVEKICERLKILSPANSPEHKRQRRMSDCFAITCISPGE